MSLIKRLRENLLELLIKQIPLIMGKSWKTTVLAIASAVAIIATQIVHLFDADVATTFSLEAIIGALGLLGVGVAARDNDVTSEDAGAK